MPMHHPCLHVPVLPLRFKRWNKTSVTHRRFIQQRGHEHTRTWNWSRGGLVERVRVGRHCGPLCSKLVAAVGGSICIAVVSVSDFDLVYFYSSLVGWTYIEELLKKHLIQWWCIILVSTCPFFPWETKGSDDDKFAPTKHLTPPG